MTDKLRERADALAMRSATLNWTDTHSMDAAKEFAVELMLEFAAEQVAQAVPDNASLHERAKELIAQSSSIMSLSPLVQAKVYELMLRLATEQITHDSAPLRERVDILVDAYIDKCDHVRGDGSTSEDEERDLIEPIVALVAQARAEAIAQDIASCRKVSGNPGYSPDYYAACETCIEAIGRLSPKPIQAHSKTDYKRLVEQGANVVPPADVVVVPREPTNEMLIAGCEAAPEGCGVAWIRLIYTDMIATAAKAVK